MSTLTDDEALLAELGVEVAPIKVGARTPQEERLIEGFEEIQRFVDAYGHAPRHGERYDIFERRYAVRLDSLRGMRNTHPLLVSSDRHDLLAIPSGAQMQPEGMDDEALLAALDVAEGDDITELRHVRSFEERRAAEEIANRTRCEDFERYRPLFDGAEADLKAGVRQTIRFGHKTSVEEGNFFILGGQMVYVAEMGATFAAPNGDTDARLRVIYSNGTESNLLMRSLQRALYKDEAGRRLSDSNAGPLFGDTMEPEDIEQGTIYVLQSLSDDPFVAERRELIHKIGITGGSVEARIADAINDPTYLLAKVRVVATYKLSNLNRVKLEKLFHRIFAPAQLDITIPDRFGKLVRPREWFFVPLHVIDEAVSRIVDGTITKMVYDPQSATLKPIDG